MEYNIMYKMYKVYRNQQYSVANRLKYFYSCHTKQTRLKKIIDNHNLYVLF